MQEGGSPAEPNSTILSACSSLEGHRSNLSCMRPSVTTGSFCFLSIFLPGTWLLLNSRQRQAVYISCEILQATKVCWDRGPVGKAPQFSFVYIRQSSTVEQHLSWCWSSSSTKKKIANKVVLDKLAQAQCPSTGGQAPLGHARFASFWWPIRYWTYVDLIFHFNGSQRSWSDHKSTQ